MTYIDLSALNYESEVANSPIPVCIDFEAEWCGPCKMLNNVIAELAPARAGKIKFCKCNIDEAPEIAEQFNVTSVPVIKILKAGIPVDETVGFVPVAKLEKILDKAIGE